MRKLGEGGGGKGLGHAGGDDEKTSAQVWRSPEGVFFISATLTVFCFLSHFLPFARRAFAVLSSLERERVCLFEHPLVHRNGVFCGGHIKF